MAAGWWTGRVRQFRRYLTGRVTPAERAELAAWLTPPQLALFDGMHRADQRHGLDVAASLRAEGHASDRELLLAGLFHDCGKGPSVGLLPRVGWSLGDHYGAWVLRLSGWLPGFRDAYERLRVHADRSAELALEAGCSHVTAELIRNQASPTDEDAGRALLLADEAN
jgi:hypothetical protein